MTEPRTLVELPAGPAARYELRAPLGGAPTLMAIGAHPDDETMLAGGTLAFAALAGFNVELVSVTRGEGGEVGVPPVSTQERLGETRAAELRRAAERLGATGVTFLPFRDPLLAPGAAGSESELFRIDASPAKFQQAIAGVVRALNPAVVLTHGTNGEYGHPQHIFTHETVKQVVDEYQASSAGRARDGSGGPIAFYTWAAAFPVGGDERLLRLLNQDDLADWLIEVTGDIHERKAAAAECHLSQHDLFRRHNPDKSIREMTGRPESLRYQGPRLSALADPFARALAADTSGRVRWIGEGAPTTTVAGRAAR